MIYLNSKIINKIGNSNRLYYNGSVIYQGYTIGGDEPDIPNATGALFEDEQIQQVIEYNEGL